MKKYFIVLILLCLGGAFASLQAQGKWAPFVTTLENHPPVAAAFLNIKFGFVKTDSGVFRTLDGGATWVKLKAMPWTSPKDQFYFYKPNDIIIAGTYESFDSGTIWIKLPYPTPSHQIYAKDGVFYDANGNVSYDHTNSWQAASGFKNQYIGGNLDSGISIWGGDNQATRYTIDGGKTWLGGHIGAEGYDGYAIPFTPKYLRCSGSGKGIKRSEDGGNTWLNSYIADYLSGCLSGDGCVVYAQTALPSPANTGLLRSTDQGNSWLHIGGPSGVSNYPICGVCSHGSVCFALQYFAQYPTVGVPVPFGKLDTLWKYSDSTLFRSVFADTKIKRSFSDTVFATECDSIRLQLNLDFTSCYFIRYQNLQLDLPSPGDKLVPKSYRINFTQDKIIRNGFPDTSSIQILPQSPGTYNLQIHLHIAATDWTGYDTIIPVVIAVRKYLPQLKINKSDTIHFATRPICLPDENDTISLSNPSCEKISIRNIRIETDSVTKNDFSISAFAPFDIQSKNSPFKIIATFHPKTTGIKKANIIIESSIGNDTIALASYVPPDTSRLIIAKNTPIDFGTASICIAARKDTVLLSNPGCSPISINDVLLETDSITFNDLSIVKQGSSSLLVTSTSAKIIVDFHPKTLGIKSARIIIKTSVGNDTLVVEANVLPDTCNLASVIKTIRSESMQFGIHPNPAQDEIEINLQSPLSQNANIEIMNLLGDRLYSDSKSLTLGSNSFHLDTKSISGGMYIVRITSPSGAASQTFVKVK